MGSHCHDLIRTDRDFEKAKVMNLSAQRSEKVINRHLFHVIR